jgi:hypothetical protein
MSYTDVSKVTDNADTQYSLKVNVGDQVHRMFYTDGNAKNVSDLFDFFGNRAKKFYHSPEVYAKETKQLGEVIDKLILAAVGILDNLTIKGLSANTFAHGKYHPGKTKITVTANKNKPDTYSESTGQEVYVHELVHAITQVGIEHDSAIRPELQRIYSYLRKEVTVNDFLDPHTLKSEQAEKEAAQRIYDRVFGKTSDVKSELHELMAYGLTNPALIRKLETLKPVTAKMDLKGGSVLEAFHNIIERIVNVFNGEKASKHIHDQLFSLAQHINKINMDQRGVVAKYLYNKNINMPKIYINAIRVNIFDKVIAKVDEKIKERELLSFKAELAREHKDISDYTDEQVKIILSDKREQVIGKIKDKSLIGLLITLIIGI